MSDFQPVILKLDNIVLVCILCMKSYTLIHINNFCEKSVTDVRKGKQRKRVFLVKNMERFALSHLNFANQN